MPQKTVKKAMLHWWNNFGPRKKISVNDLVQYQKIKSPFGFPHPYDLKHVY